MSQQYDYHTPLCYSCLSRSCTSLGPSMRYLGRGVGAHVRAMQSIESCVVFFPFLHRSIAPPSPVAKGGAGLRRIAGRTRRPRRGPTHPHRPRPGAVRPGSVPPNRCFGNHSRCRFHWRCLRRCWTSCPSSNQPYSCRQSRCSGRRGHRHPVKWRPRWLGTGTASRRRRPRRTRSICFGCP